MNYIGSKNKLSSHIISVIKQTVGDLQDKTFCELFAGTGVIASSLKTQVKKIISNDLEFYSYVLNKNYLENNEGFNYFELFDYLENNQSHLNKNFIFSNYSENGIEERLYFSEHNGKKIDTIRSNIEELYLSNKITDNVYYFCLASLLESADKVANTASVYGAYLKKLKRTAQMELRLEPALFDKADCLVEVYNQDCNSLIQLPHISGDILYLDPPYNARQYGANYHLLNTIAKYDYFEPQGKTGLRDYVRSKYCQKNEVFNTLNDLVRNANFKYIFMSYNNEGLLSLEQIKQIFNQYGYYDVIETSYQRFKADNSRTYKDSQTTEYLHILEKK
ncbi:DNA adenine methylase [Ursidibacter arcticus]